jgi:hypothetical protein
VPPITTAPGDFGGSDERARHARHARHARQSSLTLLAPLAFADNLGFDGKIVEPNCSTQGAWFDCRKIDTAPADVRRGYEYIHHTSKTLGPNGNKKFPDATPYSTTNIACLSGHFTGGHVPYGTPLYQSPDKYANRPYFRPLGGL